MIESGIVAQVKQGAYGSALGVGSTKDAAINAGVDHQASAHEAGLKRHIDAATAEAPASKLMGGIYHGAKLRMCGGVGVRLATVVCPRNDLAVANDHGPNGDLTFGRCQTRLIKRDAHVLLVSRQCSFPPALLPNRVYACGKR